MPSQPPSRTKRPRALDSRPPPPPHARSRPEMSINFLLNDGDVSPHATPPPPPPPPPSANPYRIPPPPVAPRIPTPGTTDPRYCSHCNKIFAQVADLKKHVKCVVNKEKPFVCDVCHRAFGEKSNLTRHTRAIHGKAITFDCRSCRTSFPSQLELSAHVRATHTMPAFFPCTACPPNMATFRTRDDLLAHTHRVHGRAERRR